MKKIIVSAPGKIHLLGEHAVVYGKPALLAAVNKRVFVEIFPRKDNKKEVIIENSIQNEKFEKFIYYAIDVVTKFYKQSIPSGFTLTLTSEIPIGSGMGLSAASAVSIAGAITLFLEKKFNKEIINDIAYTIEKYVHQNPSGGDNSASCYGGFIWYRKETDEVKIIKPLTFSFEKESANNFYIFNTGIPKESTGEMVTLVKKFVNKNKKRSEKIFNDQELLVRSLLPALNNNNKKEIIRIIKIGEKNLEKLGVVSSFVKRLIRKIENSGGAAKICGGGGKTKGTGIILVYHTNKKVLEDVIKSHNFIVEQIILGDEGVKINMDSGELLKRRVDQRVGKILADRRSEGETISSAHNESNLKNTAQLTQIVGGIYHFSQKELKLAYVAGSLHDIIRSSREGESSDERDSAQVAQTVLQRFKRRFILWTNQSEREAVTYAIEHHGEAPSFFKNDNTREDTPEDLARKIHLALFVADKMTANGYDVLRRRSAFVGGERLHEAGGDLREFGFEPNRDEALVVAAESAIRLGFMNPESLYPDRLKPVISPLYEIQREFVRGIYKALNLTNRDIADLLLGRRRSDGKNIVDVRKLDVPTDANELAILLAERTGITDKAIVDTSSSVADGSLETITFFSGNYHTDLDELVRQWHPRTDQAKIWKTGMETLIGV
jgi:mevalonate kinase